MLVGILVLSLKFIFHFCFAFYVKMEKKNQLYRASNETKSG